MKLQLHDRLPLTCTRAGTCCHGKAVWIHPGELARLAATLGIPATHVVEHHTTDGGIRLRFDGPAGWQGLPACTFYAQDRGCRAHPGRPLACRLYPLGRERQGRRVRYVHEGRVFPCIAGCPTVTTLPTLTVRDYLEGQQAGPSEAAADAYLDCAADLSEAAFAVAFDSGLVAAGHALLPAWDTMAKRSPVERAAALGPWHAVLLGLTPESAAALADQGQDGIATHRAELQHRLQSAFASLASPEALREASTTCFGMALHLTQALGGDPAQASRTWMARARSLGAR